MTLTPRRVRFGKPIAKLRSRFAMILSRYIQIRFDYGTYYGSIDRGRQIQNICRRFSHRSSYTDRNSFVPDLDLLGLTDFL